MIIILLFIILILILLLKFKEPFSINVGNIYSSGNITIKRDPNKLLKINELCVVDENDISTDLRTKCTSNYGNTSVLNKKDQCPKDNPICINGYCGKKNIGYCLDGSKLGIFKELPNGRISSVSIGNATITEDHLKILKGELPFSISTGNNLDKIFTNSLLTYYPNKNIFLVNSNKHHLSAQDNGSFQWNRPWTGPWESFILNPQTFKSTLQDYWGRYIGQTPNGSVGRYSNATSGCAFTIIPHSDGRVSFKGAYGGYLTYKDETNVRWDAPEITETEKFNFASVASESQQTKDQLQNSYNNQVKFTNIINGIFGDIVNQPRPPSAMDGWADNKSAIGSEIEDPVMNIFTTQDSLGTDAQRFRISNVKDLPSPKVSKPKINSIKYNTPPDLDSSIIVSSTVDNNNTVPNTNINANKVKVI